MSVPRFDVRPGPGGVPGAALSRCSDPANKAVRKVVSSADRRGWDGSLWVAETALEEAGIAILRHHPYYEIHYPDGSVETRSSGGRTQQGTLI